MDDRSTERREADDALLEAITRVIRLQEVVDDDGAPIAAAGEHDIVTDYVVVAHCTSMRLMDQNASRYAYLTRDDSTPTHAAIGLLEMARSWWLER